ncbi:MAG: amidohydrolase [Spirochaetales bacterium]|nr:amidohydrolase [Spirochaetales bacterium]
MESADIILKSNAIFTGITDSVFAGGIAIKDNRIIAVGANEDIDSRIGSTTRIYDFHDRMVMPGIIDAHMHFFVGAFSSSSYMLMDLFDSRSEKEAADMVRRFADGHPDFKRITGMGWFPIYWGKDSKLPTRASLDAAVPDRPVYLLSGDAHTFWLNTKALEECGITKDTKVSFGDLGKDDRGELTGLLFEIEASATANQMAFRLSEKEQKELQRDFVRRLTMAGITSTTNMSASPVVEQDFREYEIARELEEAGELTVRLHLYPSLGLSTDLSVAKELREKYRSGMLRVSGLKHFIDGVTSTYSAYLLAPYSDKPDTRGYTDYPPEVYRKTVVNANGEGFGVRLHAIGDGAVRLALDAFAESNGLHDNSRIKNSIEHIESLHNDDIPRFAETGTIASVQPIHLILDENEKLSRIGEKRSRNEWPFRSLLDTGATLAFGTDFPVAPINPFPNIHAAVTRRTKDGEMIGINPGERISLAEALKAYTFGGACAVNREQELGTLEPGKLADIIVLDRNLFSAAEEDIPETSVVMTITDGRIVYEKKR